MNLKKTLPILSLALVMLFTVATAMAQSKDKQAPPLPVPGKVAQLSAEDQAAMKALWKEHRQKMAPIRDHLWAKQMEYDALLANQNSKHQDVQAVIEDMKKLRVQVREERIRFQESMEAKGFNFRDDKLHGFDEDRGCGGKMKHKGHNDDGKGKEHRHHGETMTD